MSASVATSRLLKKGLSKPSLFEFSIPESQNNMNFGANDYLRLFCKATSLPEITHDVMLIPGHQRQGIVSSQPVAVKYNKPLTISVIERSDYHAYNNFIHWFQKTLGVAENGAHIVSTQDNVHMGAQRMAYRNTYTCPILLRKLELPTYSTRRATPMPLNDEEIDKGYRVTYEATFHNAYITSIGDLRYDSSARDQMVEYEVSFYYDNYTVRMGNDKGSS